MQIPWKEVISSFLFGSIIGYVLPVRYRNESHQAQKAEVVAIEEEVKKLEKHVTRIKRTFGKVLKGEQTAADLTIKSLIDTCQATPLFVAFAVNLWNRKEVKQAYPDVNKRYAHIAEQWKKRFGGVSFERAKATKFAVFNLVK